MLFFLNRIANPFVRLLLRSPLHWMLSKSLLLLSYHGRKSGKGYSLPVQYAQDGSVIYIIPGNHKQKTWWRNLRGGVPVGLKLRGERLTGTGEVLEGGKDTDAIAEALASYFLSFPSAAGMHGVSSKAGGSYAVEDLRRAADSMVMVRVHFGECVKQKK